MRTLLLTLTLATTSFAASPGPDFKPLFDGQSLAGWHKVGGTGDYRVEEGCLVGFGENVEGNTFLRTDRTYRNFDLHFSFKLEAGNSGVMFRALQRESADGNGRVYGYQCEHDNNLERAWSAGLYDEARRKWLQPHSTDPRGQAAFTTQGRDLTHWNGWNEVRILCVDQEIKIWLNGELRVHFMDTDPEHYTPEGFFALQVHSGRESRVRWRDLYIQELN